MSAGPTCGVACRTSAIAAEHRASAKGMSGLVTRCCRWPARRLSAEQRRMDASELVDSICRWKRLLQDVPDMRLDLKLDDVKPRLFPGFENWLLHRIRGPLVSACLVPTSGMLHSTAPNPGSCHHSAPAHTLTVSPPSAQLVATHSTGVEQCSGSMLWCQARELMSLRLGITCDGFAGHQLRVCEALAACTRLTELKVLGFKSRFVQATDT
jgi:hypothetical protein